MNARMKLNRAALNGCLLVAGVAGYLAGSWWVFGLALAAAIVLGVYGGDIRPRKPKP